MIDPVLDVQGWLYQEGGQRLYELALCAPVAVAIELGSWRGLSSIYIGSGLRDRLSGGKLYAIDTWLGTADEPMHAELLEGYGPDDLYNEFCSNLARYGLSTDSVVPIRSDTLAATKNLLVPDTCGLLFIDARHSEEAVLADYRAWSGRIAKSGFVIFDDVPSWPGPSKVAREVAATEFEFMEENANLWIGRKR